MSKFYLHVQEDLFWEDEHLTPNSIEAANWFDVIKWTDEQVMSPDFKIPPSNLFRGSMTMAQKKRNMDYKFANAMNWLPVFRELTFSEDGIFTDLRHAEELVRAKRQRFVRPVSPFKEFAGQVFTSRKIESEIGWLLQGKNIKAEELICLVSTPAHIGKEWRCIFLNGKYVGGSQYMDKGELAVDPSVPNFVIEFAKKIAANDYFLNIFDFVIDIGQSQYGNGGALFGEPENPLGLVEINGFETASFYAADLAKIYGAWAQSLLTYEEKLLQ